MDHDLITTDAQIILWRNVGCVTSPNTVRGGIRLLLACCMGPDDLLRLQRSEESDSFPSDCGTTQPQRQCMPPANGRRSDRRGEARPRTSTSVERDGEGFTYGPRRLGGARARAEAAFRRLVQELSGSPLGVEARAVRVAPRMGSADDCYSRCAAARETGRGKGATLRLCWHTLPPSHHGPELGPALLL